MNAANNAAANAANTAANTAANVANTASSATNAANASAANTASAAGTTDSASFRKTMDDYEAFVDSYVEFMAKYNGDSSNAVSMAADYAKMLVQLEQYEKDVDAIDADSLSAEDLAYYNEVMTRCAEKIASAGQ